MSFLPKPIMVFNTITDIGVDKIPINTYVQIHSDGAKPRLLLVKSITGFDGDSTVADLLASSNYSDILTESSNITVSSSNYNANCNEIIKIDPTDIGSDCSITLPSSPVDDCVIIVKNIDLILTNTLSIIRGSTSHKLNGMSESGELNCTCIRKLQFDNDSLNWIIG